MRVLINAVSVREGGARVVLARLLSAMAEARPDVRWLVAAPGKTCADVCRPSVETLAVDTGPTPLRLLKWYEHDLGTAVRKWRADMVFSLTNLLPRRRLVVPSLLLEHHAGYFSSEFARLNRSAESSFVSRAAWLQRQKWVHRSVTKATVLTVQTHALADAIAAATGLNRGGIRVIPHGPGWVETCAAPPRRPSGIPRLGYLTKFGVQKNFTTLFRAVRLLADEGRTFRLVLTLDPAHRPAATILAEAERLGITHLIENRGEVAGPHISDIYDSLDIFVFPSLIESFGLPMVEAMARGLPIVVADTPENREVTGVAGMTFPPFAAEDLAGVLRRLMDEDELRRERASLSMTRAQDFSWQKAAGATLDALDAARAGG